jgi:hypothetical protein
LRPCRSLPRRSKTSWTNWKRQSRADACLERLAAAPLGSFRGGERCDSGTGSEDIRRGRRAAGTCFDQILPNSERGDEKLMLLSSPLSGRHYKGRLQKRLSARSSSVVESPRSGGGSDSELIQCADDTDERLRKKNLLAATISRYHRNGICRSVGTLHRHRISSRFASIQRLSNAPWTLCGGA